MVKSYFFFTLEMSIFVGFLVFLLFLFQSFLQKCTTAASRCVIWMLLSLLLLIPLPTILPVQIEMPVPTIPVVQPPFLESLEKEEIFPFLPSLAFDEMSAVKPHFCSLSPLAWAVLLWMSGLILFALYHISTYYYLRKTLFRWRMLPENPAYTVLLQDIAYEMGLKRVPLLFISQAAGTPLSIGILRPVVFLPQECYTQQELNFILRHELSHIRNGDIARKLCMTIANAVYWFHPLVYWMARAAASDLEMACDDRVLASCSFEQRRAYGEVILTSIQKTKRSSLTMPFYGGIRTMKKRIAHI